MSIQDIFKTKSEYNKWLLSLTESEKELIIEMLKESYQLGFNEGYDEAINTENL